VIAYTTSLYTLGKMLGPEQAAELFHRFVARDRTIPGHYPKPECARTVDALTALGEVSKCMVEASTSHLGAMRSRAQHWAMQQSDCDVWLSCDDDTTASPAALSAMLRLLRTDEPRAVALPCVLRGGNPPRVNVDVVANALVIVEGPVRSVGIHGAGYGLTGVNRAALDLIAREHEGLAYSDVDGVTRLASFAELLIPLPDGLGIAWMREDKAWWSRLPADVVKLAVCVGESEHAGMRLDLWSWSSPLDDLEP
jgi:hypothetical protein